MITVFSDIKGIMQSEYLPVGQTVNHYSYEDVVEVYISSPTRYTK